MRLKKQVRTFHVPARHVGRITPNKWYDLYDGCSIHDDKGGELNISLYRCNHLDGRTWDVVSVLPLTRDVDVLQIISIVALVCIFIGLSAWSVLML